MTNRPAQVNAAAAGTVAIGGDLRVNRLGFGAMRLTGEGIWGEPRDRSEALRVLRRLPELGVNFIDTADSYGPEVSEQLIGEALHPYPSGLVIATKGGLERPGPDRWTANGHPDHLRRACEGSLRRLRLDRIDLYQLHTPDRRVPIEESVGALALLQQQGKIRHIGLSNVDSRELARAQQVARIVSVQNKYSLGSRADEDMVDLCAGQKLAYIPWFPLGSGALARPGGRLARAAARHEATPAQLALAWLLHRSPVMLVIPGTSSVKHLEENVRAAALRLEKSDIEALQ